MNVIRITVSWLFVDYASWKERFNFGFDNDHLKVKSVICTTRRLRTCMFIYMQYHVGRCCNHACVYLINKKHENNAISILIDWEQCDLSQTVQFCAITMQISFITVQISVITVQISVITVQISVIIVQISVIIVQIYIVMMMFFELFLLRNVKIARRTSS